MKTVFALLLLTGCSSLPSMQHCEKVEYKRENTKIIVHAECAAPIGGGMPF